MKHSFFPPKLMQFLSYLSVHIVQMRWTGSFTLIKVSTKTKPTPFITPQKRWSILSFLLRSLDDFHYVHFDFFRAMDVYMFIFTAGYVYVGSENRLLYWRQCKGTELWRAALTLFLL